MRAEKSNGIFSRFTRSGCRLIPRPYGVASLRVSGFSMPGCHATESRYYSNLALALNLVTTATNLRLCFATRKYHTSLRECCQYPDAGPFSAPDLGRSQCVGGLGPRYGLIPASMMAEHQQHFTSALAAGSAEKRDICRTSTMLRTTSCHPKSSKAAVDRDPATKQGPVSCDNFVHEIQATERATG